MSKSPYLDWIGRERRIADGIDPGAATRFWRTLDSERSAQSGEALPDGWQWLYFLPEARQSALGPDGHEKRGGFYPPFEAPRRMFAGGNARYHRPLLLGHPAELTERIADIRRKHGRSGPLWFLRLARRISQSSQLCIEEEQTIVYRERATPKEPTPAGRPPDRSPDWKRAVQPDPMLLLRFSALTFNAHRIHYDREYAREVEGYPGLVVHGPLVALMLLEELRLRHRDVRFESFTFQAEQPLFDRSPFELCGAVDGRNARLWAQAADGTVAMSATVVLARDGS